MVRQSDTVDGAPGWEQCHNIAYYESIAQDYGLFFADVAADEQNELAWLETVFRDRHIESVLDAGCGTGRHAIPLAAQGLRVTAVDPSGAMLRQARTRSRCRNVDVRFIQARFDELPARVSTKHDAVLVLGNSLCNLTSAEAIGQALCGIRRVCSSNGIVIIGIKDFETIGLERPRFRGPRFADVQGMRTILFEVWEYEDRHLMCSVFLVKGCIGSDTWHAWSAQTREYMLASDELQRLLKQAGFEEYRRLDHPGEARFSATSA
jgi:glycine/sarcosine N-methyltransferase